MPKFVNRMVGRTPEEGREGDALGGKADSSRPSTALSRLEGYTARGEQPEDWTENEPVLAIDEGAIELTTDYTKLGAHVASVLDAARSAAAKMRTEARNEARALAERSRKEAAGAVAAARREAETVAAEADQRRAEAERESREWTQRADAYLAETRQAAAEEAAAIVARAKDEAADWTKAAQERRHVLDQNLALTEERLRQLVGALRELAVRLEDTLGVEDQPASSEASGDAVEPDTLEESLRPSAASTRSPAVDAAE